jgi:hypothetical protein
MFPGYLVPELGGPTPPTPTSPSPLGDKPVRFRSVPLPSRAHEVGPTAPIWRLDGSQILDEQEPYVVLCCRVPNQYQDRRVLVNPKTGVAWDHDLDGHIPLNTYGYLPCKATLSVEI